MIYCTNEIRAKVWYVGLHHNRLMISITTSEKDRNGNYINSSWFARCLSDSAKTLKDVKKGDNIIIKRCAIRNTYNKKKEKEYLGLDIFEAELKDNGTEDDLPFEQ